MGRERKERKEEGNKREGREKIMKARKEDQEGLGIASNLLDL